MNKSCIKTSRAVVSVDRGRACSDEGSYSGSIYLIVKLVTRERCLASVRSLRGRVRCWYRKLYKVHRPAGLHGRIFEASYRRAGVPVCTLEIEKEAGFVGGENFFSLFLFVFSYLLGFRVVSAYSRRFR